MLIKRIGAILRKADDRDQRRRFRDLDRRLAEVEHSQAINNTTAVAMVAAYQDFLKILSKQSERDLSAEFTDWYITRSRQTGGQSW